MARRPPRLPGCPGNCQLCEPLHPAPCGPIARPEPRRPGGGGRPTAPGDPASFGKSDREDLGAPSHHRTPVLLARRAHLICPWQARQAAPLPLRCAALPPGPAPFRAEEEAWRLQPLPRRRPAPALYGSGSCRRSCLGSSRRLPGGGTAPRRRAGLSPTPEKFARMGPLRALQVRTGAQATGPELPLSGNRMGVRREARASYTVGRCSETDTLRVPQGLLSGSEGRFRPASPGLGALPAPA